MSRWWRRVRAALSMGAAWAMGWGAAGTLYGMWIVSRFPGSSLGFGEALRVGGATGATVGLTKEERQARRSNSVVQSR